MTLARRHLFAGAAAGFLGSLQRRLFAAEAPRRFVVIAYGNAIPDRHFRAAVRSETDFDLPPMFSAFGPLRSKLTIVDQCYNPHNVDLHGNGWATLSARPSPRSSADNTVPGGVYSRPSGITLDRYLAKSLSKGAPLSSLNLALNDWKGVPQISADGPDTAYPAEVSPASAFRKVFGAPTPAAVPTGDLDVLDFTRDEIARFSRRLGGAERTKLDLHLTSVSELRASIQQLQAQGATCNKGSAPEIVEREGKIAGVFGVPIEPKVLDAHVEIIANALTCGITNVASLSVLAGTESHRPFRFLGGGGRHQAQHDGDFAHLLKTDQYMAGLAAALWHRLAAVPEAGGTAADRTLILLLNSDGSVHHNGKAVPHPLFLLGDLGGRIKSGRYLKVAPGTRCVSDAYAAVANALGVPTETFGAPDHFRGPLPGLS